ncbi:patatin-like phospholipase family protein [Thiomicrorhabdus sediminis]|uniref:Patatin-like phospholipase family protein n=1 Tax=Thiomicrorhabdus sediminis TaxID=2580412 RepID=A0A4P9K4V9_9GAMM|nr:patatin-like phospholipase family protein [Thiomicrorhabdus sediminis]QCU89450.1 patatin-like phospholipase family protein [Thiomicrorhabdus sediminis]
MNLNTAARLLPLTTDYLQRLLLLPLVIAMAISSGCSSYGTISNPPALSDTRNDYSIESVLKNKPQGKLTLLLAFSGGGTRAAALSYGVLEELNATQLTIGDQTINLLDEVDIISSVSGGSFTAAYYGLHGKKTFTEFKSAMLYKDIENQLIDGALSVSQWFSSKSRTDMAIDYYNREIFNYASFADLQNSHSPLILINASDLSSGARISFTQEYFDLICSKLNHFPIAKAVAASSAVPLVFNPIVLKNYRPCDIGIANRLMQQTSADHNYELQQTINTLTPYLNDNLPYLHIVDGGITDNLGLRAIYDVIELSGGVQAFLGHVDKAITAQIAVIVVDAATQPQNTISMTNQPPTIKQTLQTINDIQIHRYNSSTITLFSQSLNNWKNQLSSSQTIDPYLIQLNFSQLPSARIRDQFNQIPTSLSLPNEQVEQLISAGRMLLRNHPQFKALIASLRDKKTQK